MEKTLSVKEFRLRLPSVIKDLLNGVSFTLIYRSKPVGNLVPYSPEPATQKSIFDVITDKTYHFKSKKSAVKIVQQERQSKK